MKKKYLFPLFLMACAVRPAAAQGGIEDYVRAYELPSRFGRDKVADAVYDVRWKDNATFTYGLQTASG